MNTEEKNKDLDTENKSEVKEHGLTTSQIGIREAFAKMKTDAAK